MAATDVAVQQRAISTCELKLIMWIREHAIPFGTVAGRLQVEYQDGRAVMIRVSQALKEEKFR